MKLKQLEWHSQQVNKVRGQLNAPNAPIDDIIKPLNMRTIVFNRRIKRLRRHEAEFKAKLEAGALKWLSKVY